MAFTLLHIKNLPSFPWPKTNITLFLTPSVAWSFLAHYQNTQDRSCYGCWVSPANPPHTHIIDVHFLQRSCSNEPHHKTSADHSYIQWCTPITITHTLFFYIAPFTIKCFAFIFCCLSLSTRMGKIMKPPSEHHGTWNGVENIDTSKISTFDNEFY